LASDASDGDDVKRRLFVVISFVVFVFDRLRDTFCRLLGKPVPPLWVVLYYHSIPGDKRAAFAAQMDELIRRATPLRADQRLPHSAGKRYASVTFDDAYQNVLENALPELARRAIPATLFVVSDSLGQTPSWEDYSVSGDPAMHELIMTEDQLQKLSPDLVQIGSHSRTHPMLTRLAEREARDELSRSKMQLQAFVHEEVKLFSFPYGAFNDELITWCRDAGYERIFTTVPRPVGLKGSEFVSGRVTVDPDDFRLEFALKLSGAYRWRPCASTLKGKISPTGRIPVNGKGSASSF
jgi:peptidoglycan/xylan/chitin deacetylase (PgdA/CDA1 family)